MHRDHIIACCNASTLALNVVIVMNTVNDLEYMLEKKIMTLETRVLVLGCKSDSKFGSNLSSFLLLSYKH